MSIPELKWDERGLVPAIVSDAETGAVLMLAWMNREALTLTVETGTVHFWSRSRASMWMKGETSGNTLATREVRYDCDADAILVIAAPAGPTCHTGTRSCFSRVVDGPDDDGPRGAPAAVLAELERVLHNRRDSSSDKSYTKSLLDKGMPKILEKIAEEHSELADELPSGDVKAVVHETADLLFHMMVGLVARDIPIGDVFEELARRFGTSGHVEKASR